MKALMGIEGFRQLNSDVETILNKSGAVKKSEKEAEDNPTSQQKKDISEEEKAEESLRKQVQKKIDEICYAYSDFYVFDRLSRIYVRRCDSSA